MFVRSKESHWRMEVAAKALLPVFPLRNLLTIGVHTLKRLALNSNLRSEYFQLLPHPPMMDLTCMTFSFQDIFEGKIQLFPV
jgi:hypothetical protein